MNDVRSPKQTPTKMESIVIVKKSRKTEGIVSAVKSGASGS